MDAALAALLDENLLAATREFAHWQTGAVCAEGTCISKSCPDWRCKGNDCLRIVPMPGATIGTGTPLSSVASHVALAGGGAAVVLLKSA